MDQDSTNGSGPDKRNWRERLGIGAQELPKLSDEFRDEAAPPQDEKPVSRSPQPVVKPAPMAPRVARKPAGDQPAAPAASERPAPAPSRATPKAPDNAVQDALAEKLRAQRAAAERLAEQRVQAARQKAEGKSAPAVPPRPAAPGVGARPVGGVAGSRPKFSFADENRSADGARAGQSPLTPPRPALGGERGQPPFLRPSLNGTGASRSASAYRSGEPGAGASPRLPVPGGLRSGASGDTSAYGGSRLPTRRPAGSDLFARRPEPRDAAEAEGEGERPSPRLGRPGLAAPAREEYEEVFEDEAPPRQRPSARDYQEAYEEADEVFADQQKRSSGPWLLFLALLLAAIGLFALFWFYGDSVRNLTGTSTATQPTETVPVVKAPEEPAKVEAETSATVDTEAPAQQKKQIYDRIVGDQEVTGDAALQPTEEIPVAPSEIQPAEPVQETQPPAPANQIPAPDAVDQTTTGQGLPEVEPPPPIPPPAPGTGQEGNLQQAPAPQVAAASAPPEPGATAPPPAVPNPEPSSSVAALPPPPETATDGAALVSETASAVDGAAAEAKKLETTEAPPPPPEPQEAVQAPAPAEPEAAPPPKKKQAAAKKKQKQENFENLGSEPVVLVPPSQAPGQDQQSIAAAPPAEQAPPAAPAKKKTIFNIFERGGTQSPSQNGQVASLEPPAPSTAARGTAPKATTGGGYLIQLSSFRSQSDAQREYARLRNDFPNVVGGLPQQIRETSVAGSTRYQLALGPISSRGEATKVCSQLIAGGESDCIVRGP
jgi:hypothetical protein